MAEKKILILGVGNILLSDEGFGVRAMEYLRENYLWPENVSLVDGGTRGLLLMAELMECDLAIILDIALGNGAPGSVYLLENEALGESLSFGQSMHEASLDDILISCDLAGHRPETLIFALEPFDYQSPKAELSPEAGEALPEFCSKVVKALAERGIRAEKLSEN